MEPGLSLPPGLETAPPVLAMGGELKAAYCFAERGNALLSAPRGDLEDADVFDAYRRALDEVAGAPRMLVADRHPDYLSSKLARERARRDALPLLEVQHHHAHIAACLADNGWPLDAPPVLGIAIDGLGWGDDGTIWGGEFLRADYRRYERLGSFKPVAMLGGARASREPWRNLYAHIMAGMGWAEFESSCGTLELYRYLTAKPRAVLDAMLRNGINSPPASSCGRLFDAVAAALGICRERQGFEAEAACALERLVDAHEEAAYPFDAENHLDPLPMWRALFADLRAGVPPQMMAARFHNGLAQAMVAMARRWNVNTAALSGGCFQNKVLLTRTRLLLEGEGLTVLVHRNVPAHDGGLALGQAAIGAARALESA